MERVIITGANGFLGSSLVRELIANNIEVIALVKENSFHNLPNDELVTRIPFELSDAQKSMETLGRMNADTFFHFAWAGSSGDDRADTMLQLNNAQWSVDCLKLASNIGCNRFINAGSITEIETYRAMMNEGGKPGLGHIYGAGKFAAHAMCKPTAAAIGIDFICAIITNAYGIGESERSPRLINTTLRKCIRGETPRFTSGTQNYDFVYIDDVARALRLIGENGKPFNEYLVGSSKARPLREFLMEARDVIAPDVDFIFDGIPFTGVSLLLSDFDCSKTEDDTGFKASISFADGIKKTMEWLKEGEDE